ncbi:sensor histidine kinase [Microbacterium sp.]|uniref:sensor histidine kinase n=1 Tax=Microbacterium sp. TaxID=51671 RepID=UPI0037C8075C
MDVRPGSVRLQLPARSVDPTRIVVGTLCALLVLIVAALVAATPGTGPTEVWVMVLAAGVFVGAGLVAWARRPHNRCGLLMIGTGLAFAVAGLQGVPVAALDTLGLLVETVPLALTLHLLMAYPSGRLGSSSARAVVAAGYVVAVVLQLPRILFAGGGSPLLESASTVLQAVAGVSVLVAATVLLQRRARAAPPAVRRAIGPLRWYGPVALAVAAAGAVAADVLTRDPWPVVAAWLQVAALAGLPLAFLAGLTRGSFDRAGEVRELLAGLDRGPVDVDELERLLGDALGDETLRVLYARGPGHVDRAGSPVAPGGAGRGLAAVSIGDDAIGLLEYDSTLVADTELVDEVARVAALAFERFRMTVELRARTAELEEAARAVRGAQRRIVRAADDERRRIARDLHDGAQQRIVALGLQAQQIARRPGDPAAVSHQALELSAGLESLLDELRALVHGVMPAALVDRGLEAAARALAARIPMPVSVTARGLDRRLPDEVESTGYFVVSESLANTVKHARAARCDVTISLTRDLLDVEVRDDGIGGADRDGSGLRGLADRVGALGGRFSVGDAEGGGTVVLAEVPCAS